MKSNITQAQQDQLKQYATDKRLFLHEDKVYTFTDFAVHENDIDIYIIDEKGEKDTWGIESWQIEEFFGWFDNYTNSAELEIIVKAETLKVEKNVKASSVKMPSPAEKVKVQKAAPKKTTINHKKVKPMRNSRVSPYLESIYEFVKGAKTPVRGVEIAQHIKMGQNNLDYYLKKLLKAGRIYKTLDKCYTIDKKAAGKTAHANGQQAPAKKNGKPAVPVLEVADTSYKIDPLLERMKEAKHFHAMQIDKLDKMIEIWETMP